MKKRNAAITVNRWKWRGSENIVCLARKQSDLVQPMEQLRREGYQVRIEREAGGHYSLTATRREEAQK